MRSVSIYAKNNSSVVPLKQCTNILECFFDFDLRLFSLRFISVLESNLILMHNESFDMKIFLRFFPTTFQRILSSFFDLKHEIFIVLSVLVLCIRQLVEGALSLICLLRLFSLLALIVHALTCAIYTVQTK